MKILKNLFKLLKVKDMSKKYFNCTEVAKLHDKSRDSIYEKARVGELKVIAIKKNKRISYKFDADLVRLSMKKGFDVFYKNYKEEKKDKKISVRDESENILGSVPADASTIKKYGNR